eukprot:TRINITY_DN12834_c0_g1_i2.p2 TRINITY_DN12834_c0_g1~~TRINITY_DN12834_c0_g1_i2.p2  ORF type:complete len:201 (-),score=-10.03 TRINITY_DN12834_c0_g1_i2:150-752(-)
MKKFTILPIFNIIRNSRKVIVSNLSKQPILVIFGVVPKFSSVFACSQIFDAYVRLKNGQFQFQIQIQKLVQVYQGNRLNRNLQGLTFICCEFLMFKIIISKYKQNQNIVKIYFFIFVRYLYQVCNNISKLLQTCKVQEVWEISFLKLQLLLFYLQKYGIVCLAYIKKILIIIQVKYQVQHFKGTIIFLIRFNYLGLVYFS